jgi:inhibitor of KinA
VRLSPLGDRAVLVTLGDSIDEQTHRLVRAVCAQLAAAPIAGVTDYVPAYASVAVHYDPARAGTYERAAAAIAAALADLSTVSLPAARVVEIPVCYGGELGPDLEELAQRHQRTPDEIVRLHSGGDYLVYMVGFLPGFAYMGGLDPALATPRRPEPRTEVPAGTVGIGGSQTGVYAIPSPGGWHLIGRTPLVMFSPDRDPPTLVDMGDRVRFRAISREEFDVLAASAAGA